MKSSADKLLKKNRELVHSEMKKVISHVQRNDDEWIVNTVMLDGYDVPFRYKRKREYRNLKGACVNLTYYPGVEKVAGFEMEVMNVIRIRVA